MKNKDTYDINFVDALAGAGKTYQNNIWSIKQCMKGEKICIIQPSKSLINQTFDDINELAEGPIVIRRIHTDTVADSQSVIGEITNYLKEPYPDGGEILLITQSAFFSLPHFHNRKDWILVCDEIPQVFTTFSKNLSDTHSIITEHLETTANDENFYSIFSHGESKKFLERMVDNPNQDEIYQVLHPVISCIVSKNYKNLIPQDNWKRMIEGKTKKGKYKFIMHSVLQANSFKGFKKVILLGAMLEDSLLYKLWNLTGKVIFKEFDEITSKLRFHKHENKGSLTIKYGFDINWSKRAYSKPIKGQKRVIDYLIDAIEKEFRDKEFVYSANNSEIKLFESHNCERLPFGVRGLNGYSRYDNAAFLPALNCIPASYTLINAHGLSSEELTEAQMYQECYQQIMRISLRKLHSESPKTVIVPTKNMAEYLSQFFENVQVEQLENMPEIEKATRGRPRKANKKTDSQRKRKQRRKEIIAGVISLNKKVTNNTINNNNKCDTLFDEEAPLRIQFFRNKYDPPSDKNLTFFTDTDDFVSHLEVLSLKYISKKDSNYLISPSTYGYELNEKGNRSRKLSNITKTFGIWLDFDDGNMTPEELGKILPSIEMYCFNTFSGNGRFRVFIPTDMFLTPKAYKRICKLILERIESNGQSLHGLDTSKFCANSLFYAPCQAITEDKDSFFISFEREPLKVIDWLNIPLRKPTSEPKYNGRSNSDFSGDLNISNFIEVYKSIPAGQGLRHKGLFDLGLNLASKGNIKNKQDMLNLLVKADYDDSRSNSELTAVINSLIKYGHIEE